MALKCLRIVLLLATLSPRVSLAMDQDEGEDDYVFLDALYITLMIGLGPNILNEMASMILPSFELIDTAPIGEEISAELFNNY